jgi:hypothetical protein
MQAEECSQGGLSCYCRTCHVGGSKEYKESEAGYGTLFEVWYTFLLIFLLVYYRLQPGTLRMPEETLREVKNQFQLAVSSSATTKIQALLSGTGIQDSLLLGILNTVVEMGKQLRKRGSGSRVTQESELKATLEKELANLLDGKDLDNMVNPLLGMEGKFS